MAKNKLDPLVERLVTSSGKHSIKLSKGLVLAFTPQPSDGRPGAGARLVWSRRGEYPGGDEDQIMEKTVERVLRGVDDRVVVAGPMFRSLVKLREGWGSSLMTWRWVSTADLMTLTGTDRVRAMAWVNGR